MKKFLGILLTILVLTSICTVSAFAAGPEATFTATSDTEGKLEVTKDGDKILGYKVGTGSWVAIADTAYTGESATIYLTGLAKDVVISVSELDSSSSPTGGDITTITVDQQTAPDPTAITATPSTINGTVDANSGEIDGVTTDMEYKGSAGTAFTPVSASSLTGLKADTYTIRTAASGVKLASAPVTKTVDGNYDIRIAGTQVTTANCNVSTNKWSYDAASGTLEIRGNIEAPTGVNDGGYGIYIGPTANLRAISVTEDSTVRATGMDGSGRSIGIYISNPGNVAIAGSKELTACGASKTTSLAVDKSYGILFDDGTSNPATLTIGGSVKVKAVGGEATSASTGIRCGETSNAKTLVNTAELSCTASASSDSVGLYCGTLNNSGKLNSLSGNGTVSTTAINAVNGLTNSGEITSAQSGAGPSSFAIAGPVNNSGTINANSGEAEYYSAAIQGSVINSGTIEANGGKVTSAGAMSYGICGPVSISAGSVKATSGTAGLGQTNAVFGNVVLSGGKLEAYSGAGLGSSDYGIYGTLEIAIPTASDASAEVIASGKDKALLSTPTYSNFTPEVYEGEASPGTKATSPVYTKKYEHILKAGTPTVTKVTIPATLELDLTTTTTGTISATVTMSDESTYTGTYTWTIADTTYAEDVSASGNSITLKAKKIPGTTIICQAGTETSNTCQIIIKEAKAATGLSVKPNAGLKVGGSEVLAATLDPTGSVGTVTWSTYSGSSSIVKLTPDSTDSTKCTITGVKNGEEIVVASLSGTGKKAYCKVTVSASGAAYKITPYYGAWYYDKTDGYTFTVNTTNTISSVKINGTPVAFSPTTYASGYQSVTIPYGTMSALSHGYSQSLVVTFADGTYVTGKVAIISTKDAPPTGDVSLIPYAVMASVSALGACGAMLKIKRKKEDK